MVKTTVVEKIKTLVYSINIVENRVVYEITWEKILYSRTGHRWKYGACALHAGYLRL